MMKYKIVWIIQETEAQGQTEAPLTYGLASAWVAYLRSQNDGIDYEIVEWETASPTAPNPHFQGDGN